MAPLLVYLKDIEVGSKKKATEIVRKWKQKSDQEEEKQLSNS